MDFKEKVVWITGASGGIGEHLTYAFAQAGAKVAISARKEASLLRVQANCPRPDEILPLPLDVTDYARVREVAAQVIEHYGYLNILVNNAGISQRSLVKDTDFAVDQKLMAVNYFGAVVATKAVLPTMLHQGFGQIVAMSSVAGKIGTPYRSAYAAAKHALHGFFDCLRAEVADQGINVLLFTPGYIATDVAKNAMTGDGSPNGDAPSANDAGMPPDIFAQKALRAIAKQREEVIIGGFETATIYLQRFVPGILRKLIRRVKVT
ncbi:MAG: SDR family oxidoreductase [Bacteroidota bacterium]